ncbi:MAG: phosphoenolpyruvate synthase [Promethearchaeota archaeon]
MDQKLPENQTKPADEPVNLPQEPPIEDLPEQPPVEDVYIKFFNEVGKDDIGMVGGKIASLGEMTQNLQRLDLKVPYGFAVAVDAYSLILDYNTIEINGKQKTLREYIHDQVTAIDRELKSEIPDDILIVKKTMIGIRKAIEKARYPSKLRRQILTAYRTLEKKTGGSVYAVRSSATAEDLPNASFAGQQDTYLNIYGDQEILDHILRCMASTFTTRATQYRQRVGFDHFSVKLSVAVQEMAGGLAGVQASGVMFSIDPDSGNQNFVTIRGTYGLGEIIVQGKEVGDEWKVFKHSPLGLQITSRTRVPKRIQLVTIEAAEEMGYEVNQNVGTIEIPVPIEMQNMLCLTDDQVEQLAKFALNIANHYGRPMDIEWVLGKDQHIYVVQARPETVESQKGDTEQVFYLIEDTKALLDEDRLIDESGIAIGRRIGCGPIKIIKNIVNAWKLKRGDILITEETNPDWTTYLEHLGGVVTERGGPTCHAAIVSREQGIPCIVGADSIIAKMEQYLETDSAHKYVDEDKKSTITIECSQGVARIWKGQAVFDSDRVDFGQLPETQTQILVNLGIPNGALSAGKHPDGTGLARLEFIIGDQILVHPKALQNYSQLQNSLKTMQGQKNNIRDIKGHALEENDQLILDMKKLKETIEQINRATEGYGRSPEDFYVQKLAEGIATIAGAIWKELPNGKIAPAVVRMSDFKTNEYRGLVGGWLYEEDEHNPMIGFRGASRYVHDSFKSAFRLECRAVLRARSWGLKNIIPMIPFVRSPAEAIEVQKIMAEEGLIREEIVQAVMEKYSWSRDKIKRSRARDKEGLVREAVFDFITNEDVPRKYEIGSHLKIYMMAEVPSNFVLAEEFVRLFDGFSIGSNDLTQLVYGKDRDNEILVQSAIKYHYTANSKAITKLIAQLIDTAHAYTNTLGVALPRKVGICGQAPSDFPEFLQFLVSKGIDSISLNFDTYAKGRVNCYRTESIENKVQEEFRASAYELLASFDAFLADIRIPRGRMRYLQQMLTQTNKRDDKLWEIVKKFNRVYETHSEHLEIFMEQIQTQQDIHKVVRDYEKILAERTEIDALIAYSAQRWSAYTQKTGD